MSSYCDDKAPFWQPVVDQYGKHMVMTNVYKPTKTKYWNIDTRFQESSSGFSVVIFHFTRKNQRCQKYSCCPIRTSHFFLQHFEFSQ